MKPTPQAKAARRKKRQTKTNGDRQYFAAVRKIRRHRIDEGMIKHDPMKFGKMFAGKAKAATKRQEKQEARDAQRAAQTKEAANA